MTPQSELEIHGNFFTHPFAELLVEIAHGRVDGSLRVSDKEKKSVIYFKSGRVVFAVSNARATRLFDLLLRKQKLTREDLVQIPNFANDFEFASVLQEKKLFTKAEIDQVFAEQIEAIIVDILTWGSGGWTFSSLARIRDGLSFEVNTTQLLVDYGRCMPVDAMLGRFRSLDESFSRSELTEFGRDLTPDEAFVLSRAKDGPLTASGLVSISALSDAAALHAIYTLWLGGLLVRNDWQPAFSKASITAMKGAKLELRTEAKPFGGPVPAEKPPEPSIDPAPKEVETLITLEAYLERVEKAETHYDILGVDVKAEADELKRAYFLLAKNFHPDRYHAEGGEKLRRIQSAFTELAQAHETLKSAESREIYDYRMRKELADREKRRASGGESDGQERIEQAAEHFERGLTLLMDKDIEASLPFLARAVHFAPKNARYHAYYGKALSYDEKQRHKAESEMQAALKLDANNPTFRIMLAEFFIEVNLLKRAEGELNRLLAVFPSNREALDLLESLKA
jgi:hypothetical protein